MAGARIREDTRGLYEPVLREVYLLRDAARVVARGFRPPL
jgi:hypothetical protein